MRIMRFRVQEKEELGRQKSWKAQEGIGSTNTGAIEAVEPVAILGDVF